ncbi:MAG: SulP family inorganic anion transporter, partial [Bacillota bacterium]
MKQILVKKITQKIDFFKMIRNYELDYLKSDITAGLSVAALCMPQNMAYALIAGLNPIYGLYTFIVSAVIATFIGISNYMVVGPANIIAVAIFSSLNNLDIVNQNNYFEFVVLLTFMVGFIQLLLGSLKLGNLVNYVSDTVIRGLTAGIALIIGVGQLNELLGISLSNNNNIFLALLKLGENLGRTNFYALGSGILTILIILLCKKYFPYLPSYFVAIIISVLLVYIFGLDSNLEIVGNIDSSLPSFTMIKFRLERIRNLFSSALSISILGFIQVLTIIKVMEKRAGEEVSLNREFVSQGIVNMIAPFFKSFVITGSITNSFANYEAGAKSRFSELFAAISVLLFILVFNNIVSLIPISSLAAIVILVAYYMFDIHDIIQSFKTTNFDALIFSVTLLTTILTPRLDYAIYFGVLVSFIIVLKNTSDINYSHMSYDENREEQFARESLDEVKEDEFIVINLSGSIHFNASQQLKENLNETF